MARRAAGTMPSALLAPDGLLFAGCVTAMLLLCTFGTARRAASVADVGEGAAGVPPIHRR